MKNTSLTAKAPTSTGDGALRVEYNYQRAVFALGCAVKV